MTPWTSGYVADLDYTYGYYTELNPARLRLAFTANGLAFPEVGTACELGFGQGLSTNLHAAASSVSWWGTDFNPAQAGFAKDLGAISGACVFDESFLEFCTRSDLPDFDFIALHGIWSWISFENREVIIDFIRRKLKVGGVLYISYNTLPGWSTAAPLRHLMTAHQGAMSAPGVGMVGQIEAALAFTDRLLQGKPLWARANPAIDERFKMISSQNRNYLAHEYFNRDWHPMYFSQMSDYLQSAKLTFAASANYTDYIDAINLTTEHQALLADITDPTFKQTVRDFMVNQQFRKDYWVKGARRLSILERSELLRTQNAILTTPRADVPLKAKGILGEAEMAKAIYEPILDALADHQPKTLGALEAGLREKNITLPQIIQAVLLLIGQGHVQPTQEPKVIEAAKARAKKLNEYIIDRARASGDISYLASPVTGGGVAVNRFSQLFVLAKAKGKKTPADWASFTWEILSNQGQKIVKDGKALETPEENLQELTEQAKTFEKNQIPILKGLHSLM